ncbi:MAG: serine/threonine protein kinase, partial [Solirubrobacteraceae bacterium]|nr:serine/threonine protein kinase [Solirubrobacteraceae bacterium]
MVRTVDETAVTSAAGAGSAPLVLGRYRLLRRLGAGAFGVVHLARDETLGRLVAIKRIELHDERVAARAAREAQAAARLSHPGIVALFEAARDDHAVHLVSEAVRGRTLAELLAAGGLSDHDALRIGAALCDALEHAHLRGVVHRDVKPANVIVPDEPGGEAEIAKLTDFGVAWIADDDALTRTGDVVGTLAYMAPEQAEGRPAGPPADLYSLALVLFEALSGVNPVRAPGAAATVRRVGSRLPPLGRLRRDLPRGLCAAIDRALLARPDQRGSLTELRDALDGALEEAAVEHGPVGPSAFETTHASLHRTLAHDAHAPHPAWTVGAGTSRPRRTAALGADARAP